MQEAVKKQKIRKLNKIRLAIVLVIFIVSVGVAGFQIFRKLKNDQVNNDIRNELSNIYEETNETDDTYISKIEKLEELQIENLDIVALIEIEGTNINYPVLQCDNNEFYMIHNYKKEYSEDGSLFLDKDYNFSKPSSNLLIYGHNNIGSNEMFAQLINYKSEDFYKNHKIIKFTTNSEEAEYEIISVFLSRVYYKHEQNVFRYYYFIDAKNEIEYNDYVLNCKKVSLYNIDATAKYGDQLLTLSTCEYSQKDGRLAIVARKIEK